MKPNLTLWCHLEVPEIWNLAVRKSLQKILSVFITKLTYCLSNFKFSSSQPAQWATAPLDPRPMCPQVSWQMEAGHSVTALSVTSPFRTAIGTAFATVDAAPHSWWWDAGRWTLRQSRSWPGHLTMTSLKRLRRTSALRYSAIAIKNISISIQNPDTVWKERQNCRRLW